MALGGLSKGTDVKVVPVGLNYFHPHKFRSRAIIEVGEPIQVPHQLVESYNSGRKHEAVGALLAIIHECLIRVTQSSPDHETLLNIHAARRMYFAMRNHKPTLPAVIEVNRRLLKIHTQHVSDPAVVAFSSTLKSHRDRLRALGIREHQLQYAPVPASTVFFTLFYRLILLTLQALGTLPGILLFYPFIITARIISHQKTKEALAASSVKLQGRDVMATWKLLVAAILAPALYILYTSLFVSWMCSHQDILRWKLTPIQTAVFGMGLFPALSYAALRIGEVGMDILKSIRPLLLCLHPSSANSLTALRMQREEIAREGARLIKSLGPEVYPNVGCILADARKVAGEERPVGLKKSM